MLKQCFAKLLKACCEIVEKLFKRCQIVPNLVHVAEMCLEMFGYCRDIVGNCCGSVRICAANPEHMFSIFRFRHLMTQKQRLLYYKFCLSPRNSYTE